MSADRAATINCHMFIVLLYVDVTVMHHLLLSNKEYDTMTVNCTCVMLFIVKRFGLNFLVEELKNPDRSVTTLSNKMHFRSSYLFCISTARIC